MSEFLLDKNINYVFNNLCNDFKSNHNFDLNSNTKYKEIVTTLAKTTYNSSQNRNVPYLNTLLIKKTKTILLNHIKKNSKVEKQPVFKDRKLLISPRPSVAPKTSTNNSDTWTNSIPKAMEANNYWIERNDSDINSFEKNINKSGKDGMDNIMDKYEELNKRMMEERSSTEQNLNPNQNKQSQPHPQDNNLDIKNYQDFLNTLSEPVKSRPERPLPPQPQQPIKTQNIVPERPPPPPIKTQNIVPERPIPPIITKQKESKYIIIDKLIHANSEDESKDDSKDESKDKYELITPLVLEENCDVYLDFITLTNIKNLDKYIYLVLSIEELELEMISNNDLLKDKCIIPNKNYGNNECDSLSISLKNKIGEKYVHSSL